MADPTPALDSLSNPPQATPPQATPSADDFDSWLTPASAEPTTSTVEVAHVFEQPRDVEEDRPFETPRAAGSGIGRGTTDARYEAVGVNRRMVLGLALAFVAAVLLALMLLAGGGDDQRAVADGPIREAAEPEFIDRAPPAPAFADPEPFAYEEPEYQPPPPGSSASLGDPYAPPPYSDQGSYAGQGQGYASGGAYANNAYASAPQTPSARLAPPVDPRRERYLRARGSSLMVDGSAGGALSVGGRTAAASAAGSSAGAFAVRPRTPGALDQAADAATGRTPDQQAAYDQLAPDMQRAVDETALLVRASGVSTQSGAMPGAPQSAPPAAGASPAPAAPAANAQAPAAQAAPAEAGPATRAEFLRRVQSGTATEPYRVVMPEPEDRATGLRARQSPLVRRQADHRGPSADDVPPLLRAPTLGARSAWGAVPTAGVLDVTPAPALSLLPGTVIPAVLLNGINSELPGDVVAQVERDVYDSASLRYVLIPKGTRLVGSYDDQVAYGQNRALVAWTTMVFPDGRVVSLPGLPGVDLQGAAGLQDRTDRHLDRAFGAAVALAAVGTGLALATPDTDGLDLSPQTVASAQVAIELSRVATQILRRELDVQPTITVRPGYRLLVFLAREMEFDGPYVPAPDVGRFRRYAPSGR